jgi:hypothetical protein
MKSKKIGTWSSLFIAHNVLHIPEGGDYEAQNIN